MVALSYCSLKILSIFIVLIGAKPSKTPWTDSSILHSFIEDDIGFGDFRNAVLRKSVRWPNKIVYYKIAEKYFSEEQEDYIKLAMYMIQEMSCIQFREASINTLYYVNITGEPIGCIATMGFAKRVTRLNLEPRPINRGCFKFGTIQHELLHVLGFMHQQNSPDRDKYVRIVEKNIADGKKIFFRKVPKGTASNLGVKYDYQSVMHYNDKGFSKNGKKTIVPFIDSDDIKLGQRESMSPGDIVKLNLFYECVSMTQMCSDKKNWGPIPH